LLKTEGPREKHRVGPHSLTAALEYGDAEKESISRHDTSSEVGLDAEASQDKT